MAMQLLKKSEVNTLRAVERKLEIDEGLKLAKRIDSLREVQAEEEASLSRFREKTVAQIHAEISELDQQKAQLTYDVQVLEQRKKEALAPLDEERERLKAEDERIAVAQEEILAHREAVQMERYALGVQMQEVEQEQRRVEDERVRSTRLLQDAATRFAEAKSTTQNAIDIRDSAILGRERLERVAQLRNDEADARKKYLDTWAATLAQKENHLIERETRLKDREATLARTRNRIK